MPLEEVKARLLADPETRAAYDRVEPAYQIGMLAYRTWPYPVAACRTGRHQTTQHRTP